jgi:hypothetical protein
MINLIPRWKITAEINRTDLPNVVVYKIFANNLSEATKWYNMIDSGMHIITKLTFELIPDGMDNQTGVYDYK